jgi:Tfp pilus assembly protein PilF
LQLSELYIRDKNVAAARQSLKRALALAPTRLETRRRLISLELEDKRPDEAMSIARALQQVPGQQALSLLLVGDIETALKKWDAAEATYRSGLKGPGAGDFAVKIHTLLLISHQDARAEQFRLSWLKEHPNDIPFRTYLGNVALGQKKFDVAEGHYLAVLAVQPENPLVINNLAWAMKQLGKPGALAYAQKANKLYPNQASFMDTLALLLADAGQLPQALEIEKRAVALQPDRGEIRLNLAKLHIKAGQAPAAKAELDRLAKLGNRFPRQAEVSELLKTL